MTRKRLSKILMSAGMGRDQARKIIDRRPDGFSFAEFAQSPQVVFPLFGSFLKFCSNKVGKQLVSAASLMLIAGDGDRNG